MPDWQANYSLPAMWYCGLDGRAMTAQLLEQKRDPGSASDEPSAPLYWAYFDLMGIPRAF